MTAAGTSRRWVRVLTRLLLVVIPATVVTVSIVARQRAVELVTNPAERRMLPGRTPEHFNLPFEEVGTTTTDGVRLVGWYVPSVNGAAVIAQHGYKAHRGEMLNEAAMLHAHGYGVLISTVRAHDLSEGELITFGVLETQDLEAWFRHLAARPDVDPGRIGILGNSMGGTIAILYAARTPAVRAVAANSAFSSLTDTVDTSVRFFTGLPPFPFSPLIVFWAERQAGFRAEDVDAKAWIGRLSPRPVLLMQGGHDVVISRDSGQRLFEAAGEPKELWFDPEIRHTGFDTARPEEYERRVVGFFDRHLR